MPPQMPQTEEFAISRGGLTSVSFKSAMSIVTLRAVIVGWLVGALVSAMNIRFDALWSFSWHICVRHDLTVMCSFGLKTGWTQGGNIMAAVISMSFFKIIKPSRVFTVQEANICQTVASSAGAIVVCIFIRSCSSR